jgi:hypothetical protein
VTEDVLSDATASMVTEEALSDVTDSMVIFVDVDGDVVAKVGEGRLRDTLPLRSRPVRCRLAHGLCTALGRVPTTGEVDAALDVLEGEILVAEDEALKRGAESFAS